MQNYSGAVNPKTSHSPPVCSMFNEIAQYFFMFFPPVTIMSVIMMTLSSKFYAIS